MTQNIYYNKYLKYKNKYLNLKSHSGGLISMPNNSPNDITKTFCLFNDLYKIDVKQKFSNTRTNDIVYKDHAFYKSINDSFDWYKLAGYDKDLITNNDQHLISFHPPTSTSQLASANHIACESAPAGKSTLNPDAPAFVYGVQATEFSPQIFRTLHKEKIFTYPILINLMFATAFDNTFKESPAIYDILYKTLKSINKIFIIDGENLAQQIHGENLAQQIHGINTIDKNQQNALKIILDHNLKSQQKNENNLYLICNKQYTYNEGDVRARGQFEYNLNSIIKEKKMTRTQQKIDGNNYTLDNIVNITSGCYTSDEKIETKLSDDDMVFWTISMICETFISRINEIYGKNGKDGKDTFTLDVNTKNKHPSIHLVTNDKQKLCDANHSLNMYKQLHSVESRVVKLPVDKLQVDKLQCDELPVVK